MAKVANFSFYGNLPTFKATRHCCGSIPNKILYAIFTPLTVIQLIALLIKVLIPEMESDIPYGAKDAKNEKLFIVIIAAVWLNIILISLVAYFSKITWLHIPLMFFEVSFFFMSCSLVGFFIWRILNPSLKPGEFQLGMKKVISNLFLAIFHGYYTYIIFILWHDTRKNIETDAFIARQHMIDDVCEEMMWEEEEARRFAEEEDEAQKYAESSNFGTIPMSGIYPQDVTSLYSQSECSISLCSAEITINTMYNTYYQQDNRFVMLSKEDNNYPYYYY